MLRTVGTGVCVVCVQLPAPVLSVRKEAKSARGNTYRGICVLPHLGIQVATGASQHDFAGFAAPFLGQMRQHRVVHCGTQCPCASCLVHNV